MSFGTLLESFLDTLGTLWEHFGRLGGPLGKNMGTLFGVGFQVGLGSLKSSLLRAFWEHLGTFEEVLGPQF